MYDPTLTIEWGPAHLREDAGAFDDVPEDN